MSLLKDIVTGDNLSKFSKQNFSEIKSVMFNYKGLKDGLFKNTGLQLNQRNFLRTNTDQRQNAGGGANSTNNRSRLGTTYDFYSGNNEKFSNARGTFDQNEQFIEEDIPDESCQQNNINSERGFDDENGG